MISVCLPTYNGEKSVLPQVQSILDELSPDDELIVSDDHSNDGTIRLLQNLDDRIRIFQNAKRVGPSKNLERAMQKANGDFIFLSDQDDLWLPGKVKTCLKALESADLVLHNAKVEMQGKILDKTLFEMRRVSRGFFKNWLRNGYSGCCMAFSKKVLQKALPFPNHLPMHDQWIGLVAELRFSVQLIEEPLIVYRIHGKNATHLFENQSGLFQKIRWRASLIGPSLKLLFTR